MVARYSLEGDNEIIVVKKASLTFEEKPDHEIDYQQFHKDWLNLQDTHDFHPMLKAYGISRTQALRLAPESMAYNITLSSLKEILQIVAYKATPIMVFTSNIGCIQIHTGTISNLIQTGPWYNVLDADFNMHLRETGIAAIWVVKKPTKDGIVTSIEVYDENNGLVVQFFGKRKPGIPENETWRNTVNELARGF